MDRARVPAPCPGGLSRSGEQPDKQQEPAASGRPQGAKADAGPGVGQGAKQGPIAEAHDVGSVDRVEQVPGLLDGKAGGLAVRGVVLAAADRLEGIQGRGVTGDEGVEEMPEGSQGLVLG